MGMHVVDVLRAEPLTNAQLHEVACRFAELAMDRERAEGREPDARSLAAVQAKRRWVRGKATDAELAAAYKAAIDAKDEAPGPVPHGTARKAARAAAMAAVKPAHLAALWSSQWSCKEDVMVRIVRDVLAGR